MCSVVSCDFRSAAFYARYSSLFLMVASLCACISIPKGLPSIISWRGAHATAVSIAGGFAHIRTASVLPGNIDAGKRVVTLEECADNDTKVTIMGSAETRVDGVCQKLVAGINWVRQIAGGRQEEIEYRVYFVPVGEKRVIRHSGIYLKGRPRFVYALPWEGANPSASIASGITTLAHETFHIVAGLRRAPPEFVGNEDLAYRAGFCARLEITGSLGRQDLMQAADVPKLADPGVDASSAAGGKVVGEMYRLFGGNEFIYRNSAIGGEIITACRNGITAAFSTLNPAASPASSAPRHPL